MELDKDALDRYITGNYGEDQFTDIQLVLNVRPQGLEVQEDVSVAGDDGHLPQGCL